MNLTEFVFKYKKAVVIGAVNVAGLVLLLLVVSLIKGAAAGSIPSADASASETVEYLADSKMKLQSKEKRLEYVGRLIEVYTNSPAKREQFVQEINNLSDGEIYQLQENVFEVAKDQIVEDAMEYARLQTPQEKREFVRKQVGKLSGLHDMMKGHESGSGGGGMIRKGGSGSAGPDLSKSKIGKGVPAEPAKLYSKVLDHTSPGDRAKVDTYISAVQNEVAKAKEASK